MALLLLALHALVFITYTVDDAYITFAYFRNFVQGKGLVFTQGSNVEATSSVLWAILLCPFELFLDDGAVVGSKILGVLCLFGAQYFGILLVRELLRSNPRSVQAAIAYSFLLACASSFVVWGTYGMEHGLVAALLTCSTWLFLRERRTGAGLSSCFVVFLLESARPEGFIYVLIFAGWRVLFGKHARRDMLWVGVLAACLALYETFGLVYFGHLLPNTVCAKVGGTSFERITAGLHYLTLSYALPYTALLCIVALLLLFRVTRLYRNWQASSPPQLGDDLSPLMFVSFTLFVHWAFVINVGGDWMPNARFLSHVIPLLLSAVVVSFVPVGQMLVRHARTIWARFAVFSLVCLTCLAFCGANVICFMHCYLYQERLRDADTRALCGMISMLNRIAQSPSAVVACSDIGRVGYYFKGRVLDWWGLADEEIARSGQALGRVDPDVVLKRKPCFIVLYSSEPIARVASVRDASARFFSNTEFQSSYKQVASFLFWDRRWHVLFQRETSTTRPADELGPKEVANSVRLGHCAQDEGTKLPLCPEIVRKAVFPGPCFLWTSYENDHVSGKSK